MSQIPTHQSPKHNSAPAGEPVDFALGPIRERLMASGFIETDPTFNLCPSNGCIEIVDVVQGRQRSLFCERTGADDAMYSLMESAGVPHMRRLWADEEVTQYAVPSSARPLSRILLSEQPSQSASPISMELPEVLLKTRELLARLARETGAVPESLTWFKLAFSKANGGEVLLIPPLTASPGSLEAALISLVQEGEANASPGNVSKIRRALLG